jgi:hypothetical protein
MEWGCYVLAGGVEVLEFCLFLVAFPARHISSAAPRFYFRKHAFCFLPLVTILESPHPFFLYSRTLIWVAIFFGEAGLLPIPVAVL